jgi:hypothetical protein
MGPLSIARIIGEWVWRIGGAAIDRVGRKYSEIIRS